MLEQEIKKLVPDDVKIEYEGEDNAFFSRFMRRMIKAGSITGRCAAASVLNRSVTLLWSAM